MGGCFICLVLIPSHPHPGVYLISRIYFDCFALHSEKSEEQKSSRCKVVREKEFQSLQNEQ